LYSNENIAAQLVSELRALGHDVLTRFEAGNANAAVPDAEVLEFAVAQGRILLTNNRRHFLRLHHTRIGHHTGIVLCTFDLDFAAQARRIHNAVSSAPEMKNQLIRINRPA
jgi:predicted nuclease of predicted toxin-antitoxin system